MDHTMLAERVEMLEETVRALVTLPKRLEAVEGRQAFVREAIRATPRRDAR